MGGEEKKSGLKEQWTEEEEEQLYQLHEKMGNRWAAIAQLMEGRTDNCVKNHFYSKLRKALRKLNRAVQSHFRRDCRPLKMAALYKVLEATDDRLKEHPRIPEALSLESLSSICLYPELKRLLLQFADDD